MKDDLIVRSEDRLLQLPSKASFDDNSSDWYCYECHSGGSVKKCESCPRVFHVRCIVTDAEKLAEWEGLNYHKKSILQYKHLKESTGERMNNGTLMTSNLDYCSSLVRFCYACRLLKKERNTQKMSKEELNYLLTFVFNRVHSWVRTLFEKF